MGQLLQRTAILFTKLFVSKTMQHFRVLVMILAPLCAFFMLSEVSFYITYFGLSVVQYEAKYCFAAKYFPVDQLSIRSMSGGNSSRPLLSVVAQDSISACKIALFSHQYGNDYLLGRQQHLRKTN